MAVRVFERDERVNAVPTTVLSSSPRTLFSAAREKRKEKAREDRGGGAFCIRELPLAYLVLCVFKQPNYFPIDIDFSDRITPRSLRSPRRGLTSFIGRNAENLQLNVKEFIRMTLEI